MPWQAMILVMNYWLLKSEPQTYSITDLQQESRAIWDGVRNYQARNFLRQMQLGDRAFFYHSNIKPPGIVGLAEVVATDFPDPTQFDPESPYFDPKATSESPRWYTVEVAFVRDFPEMISLTTLKQMFSPEEFLLVKKGNRLSVMPVGDRVAAEILKMVE
jgi:predicted RNA-binding protein with PUA-like domain